jgi:hypothetical protein
MNPTGIQTLITVIPRFRAVFLCESDAWTGEYFDEKKFNCHRRLMFFADTRLDWTRQAAKDANPFVSGPSKSPHKKTDGKQKSGAKDRSGKSRPVKKAGKSKRSPRQQKKNKPQKTSAKKRAASTKKSPQKKKAKKKASRRSGR